MLNFFSSKNKQYFIEYFLQYERSHRSTIIDYGFLKGFGTHCYLQYSSTYKKLFIFPIICRNTV